MIGERVVCIKERTFDDRLKVGKKFTIRDMAIKPSPYSGEYYIVVSDIGEMIGWIESYHFKSLSEVRLDKLIELGI